MRIIPVIDLMDGKVVHAVRGQRKKYKPLQSVLVDTYDSIKVALAFESLGLGELYIADLDMIRLAGQNLDAVERIASKTKLRLMVDAGFRLAKDINGYIKNGVEKIVLATETLDNFGEIRRVISKHNMRVVASIDLKFGKVVGKSKAMRLPLDELIGKFEDEGAAEILLLSLDRVGASRGPDYETLGKTLNQANVPVIVGGGVRNMADVRRLEKKGAAGALVATALHSGLINKDDLDLC